MTNAGKAEKRKMMHRQSYQFIVPEKCVNKRMEGRDWRATNAFHGNMEPTREEENGNRSGKNKAISDGKSRQEATNADALRQQGNINGSAS